MFILVPCKDLSSGKSRLSPCLDATRRRALCAFFLTRTLELATMLAGSDHVRIVTRDADAIAIAASWGVARLPDAGDGLNAALGDARQSLASKPFGSLMILPMDLPYATVDALHNAIDSKADVVIAPDAAKRGTNLLVLSDAARQLPFSFGAGSFDVHSEAARAAGLRLRVLTDWRLAHDIDVPEQYLAWKSSTDFRSRLHRGTKGAPVRVRPATAPTDINPGLE